MPDYRGLQECYWLWAPETSGASGQMMLAPAATTSPSAPGTYSSLGYSSMPQFSINEQPTPIMSLGSYRLFNSYKGIREYTLRAEMIIGNWQFAQLALRSANAGNASTYKGLPVMAIALGSMDTYSSAFNWVARYCMIRELSFAYAPGQPLRATIEFAPLYIELVSSQKYLTETMVNNAGGEILGWANMAWTCAGQDYSQWLDGVNVSITNGMEPKGQRRDVGDDSPISRIRRANVPTSEQVSINYNISADLDTSLLNATGDASLWGEVVLDADNRDNNAGGSRSMQLTIAHNRLANYSLQGGQIGSTLNFSASTLSGILSMTGN